MAGIEDDLPDVEDDLPEVGVDSKDEMDHRSNVGNEEPDLEWIESSPYPGGMVHITEDETPEGKIYDTYYVNVSNTTPVNDVASYIDKAWRLHTPNIILSVITNNKYTDRWKNQTLLEEFQKGIIQAVNSTDMWIITNGLDQGMTKIIGDAIYQEKQQRERPTMDMTLFNFADLQFTEEQTNLTVIGVVPNVNISYKDQMIGKHRQPLSIQNKGRKSKSDIKELNPDHSHFILVNDLEEVDDVENFRLELEERFLLPVGDSKKYKKIVSVEGSDSENDNCPAAATEDVKLVCNTNTPLVGLLLQGGPAQIDHVASLLKKQIPVIVVKGSGYAANLIAFVIQEMQERGDPDHVESYIKPELLSRLTKHFNEEFKDNEIARNKCRDKILECVDMSFQNGQAFLTILETQGLSSDLANLNKSILLALFESQSQTQGAKFEDQLQLDLKLTLDWNTCNLALTQIYQKYDWAKIKIPNELFDDALLKPDRQEFAALFLEKKSIMVHKYLHHKKLLYLFNNVQNPEFFMTLCIEGVLERALDNAYPLTKQFLIGDDSDLNLLLYKLTNLKALVSTYDLSMNAVGKYVTDVAVAERRAINTLVLWAALTNNVKLTKTLWKYTDDPMPVALLVSMIWHNLAKICYRDVDTKTNLREAALDFGKLAVKLLDITYRDSPALAIASLEKTLPDFNNHAVIEVAKISRNKMFIAHSICQKWLARKWYGNLNIREVDFKAFRLPDWFKIYMSIFLIFPMFIWITFERKKNTRQARNNGDSDEELMDDEALLMKPMSNDDRWILSTVTHGVTTVTHGVKSRIDKIISYGRQNLKVPIYLQFYYFWSAPITKFWVSQLFYILYLIFFSLSVIIPSCGNIHMDFIVFIWTALIWMEIVRTTFVMKKKYQEIRLFWTIAEIFFMGAFVATFCLVRIVPHFTSIIDYMTTKFVLSLGLLYFYYRTLFVFLRISPVLGPMLISIKRMVKVDFLTWMRLFLIVMVSGGITIQATLYPNYPFDLDAITRAMSRAFFAMFLTKIDDLEGDDSCSFLYKNHSLTHCIETSDDSWFSNSSSPTWSHAREFRTCPYSSYGGYFMVIQYLLLTKLILVTLLYALFSATQAQVAKESSDIWKYQRYSVIVDFDERLRLPPPLTVISYFLLLCEWLFCQIRHCFRQCKKCCRRCCRKKPHRASTRRQAKMKRSEDFSYWRKCVKKLVREEEEEIMNNERSIHQSQAILVLQTEMEKQKTYSKKLFQQIARLERGMTTCQISLESMKHFMETLDTKRSGTMTHDVNKFHIESRKSPYPSTQIQRFPIFDKYVPWEVPYLSYDPALYTCPIEHFPEELQIYIDLDLLDVTETVESPKSETASLRELKRSNSKFDPMWNDKTVIYVGDVGLELDRTSWIYRDGIPFMYELDSSGVPQNPVGRTGLRGRGNLWRWGPNHNVIMIITRWKKITSTDYMAIDGKHVMEFVLVDLMDDDDGYLHLPRGRDYGNISVYSDMCKYFQKHVLEEDDSKINKKMKKQNMIEYFAKFSLKTRGPVSGFTSQMLYRGYYDHRSNTDNAWNEAEIWNIHYQGETTLDEHIKDKDKKWREATSRTKLFGNQDFIVQRAATLHSAYY